MVIQSIGGEFSPPIGRVIGIKNSGSYFLAVGRGSSSHVKLNFKKYRLFVRLKFYHLKKIEQTDVDKSKRR